MESDWGGRATADVAGGVDGRQQEAELVAGVDGEGEGPAASAPILSRLRCVALCGATRLRRGRAAREVGPRREEILDLFEGTQQIQLLIVARLLLGQGARRAQVTAW